MTALNFPITHRASARKATFISICLALYVFSMYLVDTPLTRVFGSAAMFAFVGLTWAKIVFRQTPVKISSHSVWYFTFAVAGLLSLVYALSTEEVLSDLYLLMVAWILAFSFVQYVQETSGFVWIFHCFVYSAAALVLFLLVSGQLAAQSQLANTAEARLGSSAFGNPNNLAMVMMVAACCLSWLILYGNRLSLLLYIPMFITFFYVIALTGGRKFFLMPFVFILLLIILKDPRGRKLGWALYALFFVLAGSIAAWAIVNIPSLHNSIGSRLGGMLNVLNGDLMLTDSSTMIRLVMIDNGWNWFLLRPAFGYGLNNFRALFSQVWMPSYAHNNYIELMVDLGLVGLAVYYSFYAYIIAQLIRIRGDPSGFRNFFLAFLLMLAIFDIGAVTYNMGLIQIFLGLASAYLWLHQKKQKAVDQWPNS